MQFRFHEKSVLFCVVIRICPHFFQSSENRIYPEAGALGVCVRSARGRHGDGRSVCPVSGLHVLNHVTCACQCSICACLPCAGAMSWACFRVCLCLQEVESKEHATQSHNCCPPLHRLHRPPPPPMHPPHRFGRHSPLAFNKPRRRRPRGGRRRCGGGSGREWGWVRGRCG